MRPTEARPQIDIRPSDRVCFFGATGSGKTTMAKRLLRLVDAFVVLDSKGMYEHRGVPIMDRFDPRLRRSIIRLPRMSGPGRFAAWEAVIDQAYNRGNIVIYVDEVIGHTGSLHLPEAYQWAVKTGRQRNVGVWSGTQRPSKIPTEIMSEAEHFFIGRLQTVNDRDKAATFTSDAVRAELETMIDPARPDHHDFLYVHNTGRMLYLRSRPSGGVTARPVAAPR